MSVNLYNKETKELTQIAGNGEVFSYDEVAIGKWVDGKTLYRKVVTGTASFANHYWTDITISSDNVLKNIKRWDVCIIMGSLRMSQFNVTNTVRLSTVTSLDNGSMVEDTPYTLILEYTK
jgi:hypothetical protein